MELESLKKKYSLLATQYGLPSFVELDENFEIGKIKRHGETVLRVVRKVMMEKIISSLGFVEMLLNPMNAQRTYHAFIKSMTTEDKSVIDTIYIGFTELSLVSLEREIEYSENGEAELIKKIFAKWNETKPLFKKLISSIRKPNLNSEKKERSYFG